MKDPKYQDGDTVALSKPTLYGETRGVIVGQAEKVYAALWDPKFSGGKDVFEPRGLCIGENSISSISLPYKLEGGVLEIDYTSVNHGVAKTRRYKEKSWSYHIKTPKMNSIYPERALKKI